jgi:MFS family permease
VHNRGHLRRALSRRDFRRLLRVRLIGQFGDGVFQVALAGAVLFNPERQAHAADVAAGFAVILLPYSLVGPFAGVFLDRWSRQRVLLIANLLRAVLVLGVAAEVAAGLDNEAFYISALLVVSVNRFFLSALSASLPHVVETPELVTANALSTTSGGIAATLGGAFGIAVRGLTGDTNVGYGIVGALALLPYLASALTARGFGRPALGPDDVHRNNRETARAVVAGLVAGARYVARIRPVYYALTVIGIYRFCYGITTITTLLLYRNYLTEDGFFRAGLAGLAQVVLGLAIGSALAAVVTPPITRRLGFVRWAAILLLSAAAAGLGLILPYRIPLLVLAAAALGFTSQGIKICVDTLLQQNVADEFRGRVFTLYDTLFNVTFVAAAVFTALLLPDSGHSPATVVAISVVYVATAIGYLRFHGRGQLAPAATEPEPEPVAVPQ